MTTTGPDYPDSLVPGLPEGRSAGEVGTVARELAAAYRQMVAFYREQMQLPVADAEARARGDAPDTDPARDRQLALDEPADQVSWFAISRLAERDPDAALAAWERVKAEAADELRSGHRTAKALEWGDKPWDRARYLAVLAEFREAYRPRDGIEAALVDVLTQAFVEYLKWTEIATVRAETEAQVEERSIRRGGYWAPPRVAAADAIEEAARRADAAHRRFLATIRALQDLRRLPTVHVERAEQVNVGGQQIVLAAQPVAPGRDTQSGATDGEVTQRDGLGAETARRRLLHAQPKGRRTGRPRVRRHGNGGGAGSGARRGTTGRTRRGMAGAARGAGPAGGAGRGDRRDRRAGGGGGPAGADGGGVPAAPPRRVEEATG